MPLVVIMITATAMATDTTVVRTTRRRYPGRNPFRHSKGANYFHRRSLVRSRRRKKKNRRRRRIPKSSLLILHLF